MKYLIEQAKAIRWPSFKKKRSKKPQPQPIVIVGKSCVKQEVQSQVRHAIEDVSHLSCDRC